MVPNAEIIGRLDGKASGSARARAARRRQSQILTLRTLGMSQAEMARKLGVSDRTIWRDLAELGDAVTDLEAIIEDCGLNAEDIHLKLSQMADADLSDIAENPESPLSELKYKPLAKWPAIWRQGLAGKIRITPVAVPDGQRTAGGDPRTVKIEIERADILKVLELAARLRAVDANVDAKPGDTNIVFVTAETARKVVGAKKRLERVIDVPAKEITDGS